MDTKGCNNRSIPRRIDVSLEGFLVVGEAPQYKLLGLTY